MGTKGAEAAGRKSAVCKERNRLEGASDDDVGAGGHRARSKLSAKNGESECLLPGADGSWLSHHSPLCYEQFEPLQSDPSITDQLHCLDDKTHGYNGTWHLPRDLQLTHQLGDNEVDLARVLLSPPVLREREALTCGAKCSKHKTREDGRTGSWAC